jgi:mercuric ion transport protein
MKHSDETVLGLSARPAAVSGGDVARQRLAVTGGLLGALAASSCCILPLVLFGLGISGAWLGNLTVLAPYQPIFVAVTLGFLGYGYYLVYAKPKKSCAADAACARPLPGRSVRLALWAATLLIMAALAFPYVAPALLGV